MITASGALLLQVLRVVAFDEADKNITALSRGALTRFQKRAADDTLLAQR